MLELDADLEADLGIDSIKRVEIAGTIVESLPVAGGIVPDPEAMTAARTLREAVDVLEPLLTGGGGGGGDDAVPFVREPADQRIGRHVLRAVEAPRAPARAASRRPASS